MTRSRIGAYLLIILCVGGLLATLGMTRCNEPIAEAAALAGEAALRDDWENALSLAQGARDRWEKYWGFSAAFADHAPMENINGLFAQLEVYGRLRDPAGFAAVCAQLKSDAEAMGDAHSLNWWNLL